MREFKLGAKQRCFAEEYMIDLDATQAAIRAGYSAKTAGQAGYELLQKPAVKTYIYSLIVDKLAKIRATPDRIFDELGKIAFTTDDSVKASERLRALQILGKYTEVFEKLTSGQMERVRRELDPSPLQRELRRLEACSDSA